MSRGVHEWRALGAQGLPDLLVAGVGRGVHFWDLAGQYGTHPYAKRALKTVKRDQVTILTKTHASTEAEMSADLDRFRQEIGTDYLASRVTPSTRSGPLPRPTGSTWTWPGSTPRRWRWTPIPRPSSRCSAP
jgi:hypothetical protein